MSNGNDTYAEHVKKNEERYLRELTDFLSIPSISTLSEHKGDVQKATGWYEKSLTLNPRNEHAKAMIKKMKDGKP